MLRALDTVRIFTADLTAARAFYEDVLKLPRVFAEEGIVLYAPSGAHLLVEEASLQDPDEAALIGRFTGISFSVDNLEDTVATLSARGVHFAGEPEAQPWGGSMAHFLDPDGNVLTLVQYPPETG